MSGVVRLMRVIRDRFPATDPEQLSFRKLVGVLDDEELVQLEEILSLYDRFGVVSPRLERLLARQAEILAELEDEEVEGRMTA